MATTKNEGTTATNGSKNVTVEDFIKVNVQAYQEGKSVQWIADTLGLSKGYVQSRRSQLRTSGVPLPDLQKGKTGGGSSFNLEEAQALLAKMLKTDPKEIAKQGKELIKASEQRKGTAA